MSAGGYDAFEDPYVYKGTTVLKNRLGLRDLASLEQFEIEATALRAEEELPLGRFSPSHYCAVHRHLFQDVYRWAGRYRTVKTSKNGNVFCYPENIPVQMTMLFAGLDGSAAWKFESRKGFAVQAASFLGDLNAIHPFREGNGRSQLAFMHVLSAEVGYPLQLERIERATFLPAMVASFAGDLAALENEFMKLSA